MTRADVLAYTPTRLVDAAEQAIAAPRDDTGLVSRSGLLVALRAELDIFFADMVEALPRAGAADITPETTAAQRFRAALVMLWAATRTFEVSKDRAGGA